MLGDALDVEEVDFARATGPVFARGAAGPGKCHAPRFAVRREARADFEQPHPASLKNDSRCRLTRKVGGFDARPRSLVAGSRPRRRRFLNTALSRTAPPS